ncbi:MAG: glycosyltransferase family 4 protein [Nitrospinota bacterium]
MKILQIVSSNKWSGAVEPTARLALDLKKIGHSVDLLCQKPNPDLEKWLKILGLEADFSLSLDTKFSPLALIKDVLKLRRIIKDGGYDVIHSHLSQDHLLLSLATIGLSPRPLIVRTFHNMRSTRKRPLRQLILSRSTDAVITVSEGHKRELLKNFCFDSHLIKVVRGGVDLNLFNPAKDGQKIRAEFGIGDNIFLIGIVSRLVSNRRHSDLIEAVAKIADKVKTLRLIIVGRGEYMSPLKDMVEERGMQDIVIFSGYKGADLPETYNAMDAKVLLTEGNDGTCRAALEAMASGKPLVVYDYGALPDIVEDGVTGYIIPNKEIDGLAKAILKLAFDRESAKNMGELGRKRAEQYFDSAQVATETERFYTEILPL